MKRIALLGLGILVGACYEEPQSEMVSFDGLEYSRFSDFNLPSYTQYFELRQGEDSESWSFEHQMMIQFDPQGYGQLDIGQQLDIDFIDTTRGLTYGCVSNSCPIYIAAVGETVQVIDSPALLKSFLGDIDTPSECALWLMQYDLELMETHRYADGVWSLHVVDKNDLKLKYRVVLDPDGTLLSQEVLDEQPTTEINIPDIEIHF